MSAAASGLRAQTGRPYGGAVGRTHRPLLRGLRRREGRPERGSDSAAEPVGPHRRRDLWRVVSLRHRPGGQHGRPRRKGTVFQRPPSSPPRPAVPAPRRGGGARRHRLARRPRRPRRATLTLFAPPRYVDVATTTVNRSDASTDTVVFASGWKGSVREYEGALEGVTTGPPWLMAAGDWLRGLRSGRRGRDVSVCDVEYADCALCRLEARASLAGRRRARVVCRRARSRSCAWIMSPVASTEGRGLSAAVSASHACSGMDTPRPRRPSADAVRGRATAGRPRPATTGAARGGTVPARRAGARARAAPMSKAPAVAARPVRCVAAMGAGGGIRLPGTPARRAPGPTCPGADREAGTTGLRGRIDRRRATAWRRTGRSALVEHRSLRRRHLEPA